MPLKYRRFKSILEDTSTALRDLETDAQADLRLCSSHMTKDIFSHGPAHIHVIIV